MWLAPFLCSSCFVCWKRILFERSFFISKVILMSGKQDTLQDVLSRRLMIDFQCWIQGVALGKIRPEHQTARRPWGSEITPGERCLNSTAVYFEAFINKNRRWFSSWTNHSPNHNPEDFCRLSIMADGQRYFERIQLLCRLWKFVETFCHWSWTVFIDVINFSSLVLLLATVRFLELFHFLRQSKELFHNLVSRLAVDGNLFLWLFFRNVRNATYPLYGHFAFSLNVDCSFFTSTWSVLIIVKILEPFHVFRYRISWNIEHFNEHSLPHAFRV